VPIEEIAHSVGRGSSIVTEPVYRKELRPVITRGAYAINVGGDLIARGSSLVPYLRGASGGSGARQRRDGGH
jgi:hypothetical protein